MVLLLLTRGFWKYVACCKAETYALQAWLGGRLVKWPAEHDLLFVYLLQRILHLISLEWFWV